MSDEHFEDNMKLISIAQKRPLIRLWMHRAKRFLYDVLKMLPEDILNGASYTLIVSDTLPCVMKILNLKLKLGINLYDAAIACLWKEFLDLGIPTVSLKILMNVARNYLNHKVSYGRIIRILSYIRRDERQDASIKTEIMRYLVILLDNLWSNRRLTKKLSLINKSREVNGNIKLFLLSEIKQILDNIPTSRLIGPQRKVLAAALLYAILKIRFPELNFTSADIESISGLSRFTILRRYKLFSGYIRRGEL